MGIADLRAKAREVLEASGWSLKNAFLGYKSVDGKQMQVITLTGARPDGSEFSLESTPHDPNLDPNEVAKETAQLAILAFPGAAP